MTREGWGWTLAVAFAAGLLFTWYRGRVDAAERAAAVARADTLEHLTDSLERAHTADSTAAAQVVERLADSLKGLDRGVVRLRWYSDSLTRAIATTAGDVIPKAQALAALGGKDALLMRQAVKIATLTADTTAWRRRWLGSVSEATSWHTVALEAQRQLKAANRRSAPKWGCTVGPSTLIGAGLTGGVGAVAIGPTAALGLGVTCGLHL